MSATILQLTAADAGLELSREEYAEADWSEGVRFERSHGRLVAMPPAGHDHHVTSEPIRDHLVVYKLAHPDVVEHVFEESWTAVDDDTDRIPDLAVYLKSADAEPLRIPDRVPELIFEIISPGRENRRRDYDEKRDEYERLGVLEYVIVDRFDHEVTVLRLVNGQYQEQILKPTDTYRTPLLPGLEIPLQPIIGS
jgi:Uma2 family endonuclease